METDFYDEAAKNGVEVGHYYFRQQLDDENAIDLVFTFCKYEGKYVIRTEKRPDGMHRKSYSGMLL